MDIVRGRCCGLDVHKKSISACLLVTEADGVVQRESRTFGTMTRDIEAMSEWLTSAGCTHIAMESTGSYWKPVYNILEGEFEAVLVVNARDVKNVPGRKTDVGDAEWIATLLQHGLLKGSLIPSAEQRALRDLTRYRDSLVRERAQVVNRLQAVLEDANIKLASVASDVMGVSARAILESLVGGSSDAATMAELAKGRLRTKRDLLERALEGRLKPHHRFLVTEHLSHIDYLDESIAKASAAIEEAMRPFDAQIALLDTIPGINRRTAENLLAEIGVDMSRFASAAHLASWAGMCPGNNESAGKRRSGKTRKGSRWLRHTLVEAAHGAARKRGCVLGAQYHRIAGRRGKKRALVAVGHTILVIAYYVLSRQQPYTELGADYYDRRARDQLHRQLVRRLERLGYQVEIRDAA